MKKCKVNKIGTVDKCGSEQNGKNTRETSEPLEVMTCHYPGGCEATITPSSNLSKNWMCKVHRLRMYKAKYKEKKEREKKLMQQRSSALPTASVSAVENSIDGKINSRSSTDSSSINNKLATNIINNQKMELMRSIDVIAFIEYQQDKLRRQHLDLVRKHKCIE